MPRYYETQDGITIDIAEVLEQYRDEIKKTADKNPDNKSLQAQVAGRGVGKIRHLDAGCLWSQEKEAREQLRLAKEPCESNPADLGTQHLSEDVVLRHLSRMSCEFRSGRP